MDDEKLIECVKAHTVLYNLDHEQYQDINLKNNIWKKIGIQLNQPSKNANILIAIYRACQKHINSSSNFAAFCRIIIFS